MKNIVIAEEDSVKSKAVQPYKLVILMRVASQIVEKLCSLPQFVANYDDIEFVLETVGLAVERARKVGRDGE